MHFVYRKKTNEWVLNKAGVKREPLETGRKLAYIRKQGNCLEKKIMQGTMPGACRRGRPGTACIDNTKMWTGFPVEESKINGESTSMVWPTLESRMGKEQNKFLACCWVCSCVLHAMRGCMLCVRVGISKYAVVMLGDGALPVVMAIVRGAFGRHAWTMQLRHQSRSRKVSCS